MNEIYNVATGVPTFLGDIIDLAAEKLNSGSLIEVIDPNSTAIGNYLDISKLKSLGFVPKYSINDIVERLIK